MQIENISAIPQEIDTVEKLYLWCYYQLSSTTERIDIEGGKEFVIDSELIRPDGVDPRLFLITKINLPIDENWLINTFKLWENAQEILEGLIEAPVFEEPFGNSVLLWLKGDDFTDSSLHKNNLTVSDSLSISSQVKKYGTGSIYISNSTLHRISVNLVKLIGDRDFTLEFWEYRIKSITNTGFIFFSTTDLNIDHYYKRERVMFNRTMGLAEGVGTLNTWHHVAFVKTGATIKKYLDGTFISSMIKTGSLPSSNWILLKAEQYRKIQGYIEGIRITIGARYLSDFNPETDTYLTY